MTLFTAQEAESLAQENLRVSILFRLEMSTSVLRVWTGTGPLKIASDGIETTDLAEYYGAGEWMSLPVIDALLSGTAQRAEFTLSGADGDSEIFSLADADADEVRGARLNIGVLLFDADWQPIFSQRWLWEGEADTLDISRPSAGGRILTLSVGSAFTGRRRAVSAYYSDAEQKARSSDDLFCERVSLMKREQNKPWPRV